MIILGLDIASKTGWALYDSAAPLAQIETGALKVSGETPEDKAASLAMQFADLLLRFAQAGKKVELVMIEQPIRINSVGGAKAAATQIPVALAGSVAATCAIYRKPCRSVPIATWRKGFLGAGRVKGRDRAAWKRLAIDRCRQLGIEVKGGHDAAEAVGIAFYGANSINVYSRS